MIEYKVKVHPNGHKFWYLDCKLHREDGPAVEWANGNKEWWLNGREVSEREFNNGKKPNRIKLKECLKQLLECLEEEEEEGY